MKDKIATYTTVPVDIQAVQWTGNNIFEVLELTGTKGIAEDLDNQQLIIKTLQGEMRANKGNYIIKGVKGEIYPCKPDIFEMTYVPKNC